MKAQVWRISSLAGVTVLALACSGAWAQPAGKPAAVVNGTPITMAEVEAVLKQAPPSPTALSEMQKRQRQMEAVAMLIDDLLMQQFLMKHAPRIDPADVNRQMADLLDSLKKSGKSFQEFLAENGQSEHQLRGNIVTMLQWNAYVKDHLTDADVRRYYEENKDFFDRIDVRASHIVIRLAPEAGGAER